MSEYTQKKNTIHRKSYSYKAPVFKVHYKCEGKGWNNYVMRTDMVTNKGLTVGLKELKVRVDLVGRMYAVPQFRGR